MIQLRSDPLGETLRMMPAHTPAKPLNPGSCLHYSFRYSSVETRHRALARLGMIKAMTETLLDVSEQQVAQSKIHWWHEEIDRLIAGKARHPAVLACQAELTGVHGVRQNYLQLLSVAAKERYAPAADAIEADARLQQDLGAQLALVSHALLADKRVLEDCAFRFPDLAKALGKVDRLLRLPRLLHRGYGVFSNEYYSEHQLTSAELAAGVRVAGIDSSASATEGELAMRRQVLLHTAIAEASHDMQTALGKPPFCVPDEADADIHSDGRSFSTWRPGLLPLISLTALRARQLQLWKKKPPNLLRERTTLTPVSKFLITWHCKRRYGGPAPS